MKEGWLIKKPVDHIVIDLGSGDPSTPEVQAVGYLKQDIAPYAGIDLVCDIRSLRQYINENECDKIRMSHVLEHFTIKEGDDIVKMIYDLLAPRGVFEVIVPNFRWHARLVMSGRDKEAVYYCFVGQLDEWDYHKTAYTPAILFEKLQKAGFSDIQIDEQTSIICNAIK